MKDMVDWRKVRPRVKKAPLAVLVKIHQELMRKPDDDIYRETVVQQQFDPIQQKTQDIADLLHGPLAGPYQESLRALEGLIVSEGVITGRIVQHAGLPAAAPLEELDRRF